MAVNRRLGEFSIVAKYPRIRSQTFKGYLPDAWRVEQPNFRITDSHHFLNAALDK